MKFIKEKSNNLLDSLGKSKVHVTLAEENHNGFPMLDVFSMEISIVKKKAVQIEGLGSVPYTYIPFELTFNEEFSHSNDAIFFRNSKYHAFFNKLLKEVVEEIDHNIKLRLSKWEILDFLSLFKSKLKSLKTTYSEISHTLPDVSGKLYRKATVHITSNQYDDLVSTNTYEWMEMVLSSYWVIEMDAIDYILDYITTREGIIGKAEDYVQAVAHVPVEYNRLTWKKSDTDLLELVTALVQSGAIQNGTHDLTRKEAIEMFTDFFNIEIKDAESKLSRATNRKKDVAQFLSTLKSTFEDYADDKDERLDSLRK